MSDSQQTGRIKSQRNMGISGVQSRLIKQYDTQIDYDRLKNLRAKYISQPTNSTTNNNNNNNNNHQYKSQQRVPLSNILNSQLKLSHNNLYIRQRLKTFRQQYSNVIFGTHQSNINTQKNSEKQLINFKSQIDKVNEGIGNKLQGIQQQIRLFRLEKQKIKQLNDMKEKIDEQSRWRMQQQSIRKTNNQTITRMKEQSMKRIEAQSRRIEDAIIKQQLQRNISTPFKMIEQNQRQLNYKHYQHYQHQQTLNQLQLPNIQPIEPIEQIQQSYIALKGQIKKYQQFTKQFTLFVNRLKDQIYLDNQFTKIILDVRPQDLLLLKGYMRKYHPKTDLAYFDISPIQMDPLYIPRYVNIDHEEELQKLGEKCYQFYKKIEDHYQIKLYRKYTKNTIDMFYQQLGLEDEISLGHIISYINMRTQSQFRNRDLVKILRRLNICTHFIEMDAFYRNFTILHS